MVISVMNLSDCIYPEDRKDPSILQMVDSQHRKTPLPLERLSTRKRRPNWTDQECMLLAQLMDERKEIIRGKCSTGVTTQDKRQAWEEISQTINDAFPQIQRTVSDCNKKWENLLAKSREEIKKHKNHVGGEEDLCLEQFSEVTQMVISVMNLSDSIYPEDRKDPSILQLVDSQHSFNHDEENNSTGEASTAIHSVVNDTPFPAYTVSPNTHSIQYNSSDGSSPPAVPILTPFPGAPTSSAMHFTTPCSAVPITSRIHLATPRCSTPASVHHAMLQDRMDLEMSVLRRQEAVLKLQEEYYTLKIQRMKENMEGPLCKRPK